MAGRTKRGAGAGEDLTLPERYEGAGTISELLARAGSPFDAEEAAKRFRSAQASGEERSDAIPALFPEEPRFASPEEARRLYSNLFGLWSRVAAGDSAAGDDVPAEAEEGAVAPPPLPERGAEVGDQLTAELVEAVWKHLDALPEREQRRLRHRFESAQPDLVAWLDAVALSDATAIAAQDLAFETWAMFDVAFGDRLEAVPFADLSAVEEEPPALEATQPALATYVGEVLDMLADEDATFGAEARAQVERVVAAVAAALSGVLEEE